MAFDVKGYRQAAIQAGIPQDVINKTIADRTGVAGWFTGGRQGIGGALTAAGNVLNLPSYAVGGMLDEYQKQGRSAFNPLKNPFGISGAISGIKNKEAVFQELPESLGIDPNSTAGMVVGLGGELLVPGLPLGKVGEISGVKNIFSKGDEVANIFSKGGKAVAEIAPDAGRTLLEKSYKLSASDIDKIAEAIGVSDEAQKATKVIDYLEGLGLTGANRQSLGKLNTLIKQEQKPFNALVKTGGEVSRKPYIDNLLQQAIEQERLNTPRSRRLAKQLFDEAYREEQLVGKPLTDTDLTKKITQLFSESGDSAIADPFSSNLSKQIAKAGQEARETLRPGSTNLGRNLRKLRTSQEVLGKKANTGLGTQLVNAFKPSALGIGLGAATSYSTGGNPFVGGVLGAVGGAVVNNPRTLNLAGKVISNGIKTPQTMQGAGKIASEIGRSTTVQRIPQAVTRSIISRSQNQVNNPKLSEEGKSRVRPYKPRSNFQNAISKRLGVTY